jgi:hypothetical protein
MVQAFKTLVGTNNRPKSARQILPINKKSDEKENI